MFSQYITRSMGQYFHTSDIWVNIIIFYIFYYLRELLLSPFMITVKLYTYYSVAAFDTKPLTWFIWLKSLCSPILLYYSTPQPRYGNLLILFKNNPFCCPCLVFICLMGFSEYNFTYQIMICQTTLYHQVTSYITSDVYIRCLCIQCKF